jgi:folate-dependent phosphoribosylglycinamide formyltransferase PurN
MRVVFLAVDDEFAGLMQKYVYEHRRDWVVGSVISSSVIYRKSALGATLFLIRQSGLGYLLQMTRMKIVRRFFRGAQTRCPAGLARGHGVEQYRTSDINSKESLAKLRSWKPDLVISTNFSHYIGKEAREVPAVGMWNLHKSLLPRYRGMAPNFYALLEDATSVGATLHVVTKGFDTGDVLAQVEVPVGSGDTVYELNKRTADVGGRMLLTFLECLDVGNIRPVPQPQGQWRTYSYPTRADVRAFRRKGCRF